MQFTSCEKALIAGWHSLCETQLRRMLATSLLEFVGNVTL